LKVFQKPYFLAQQLFTRKKRLHLPLSYAEGEVYLYFFLAKQPFFLLFFLIFGLIWGLKVGRVIVGG
jgi:hypothetical protein